MTEAQTTEATNNEKPQEDVRNLQDKFHGLLDQRNHFNELSREARNARNALNDQRREKASQIDEHKAARDECNAKMREHKELRNSYQDQAKALISQKKGKAGGVERSLPMQARKLKGEIEKLILRQETTVLGPKDERALLDDLRLKRQELAEIEGKLSKQQSLEVDLSDTDKAIDTLFGKADEEHAHVKKWHNEANEHHAKFVECVKEVRIISEEADAKHKEFVAYKTKADEFHNKAMELREKVMAVRGERRAQFAARRQEVKDLNTGINQRLNDPKALEKANESALDALKKGGKISLGF
ncbi:MAG: coiled-coil protein [Thermoplasmatota archaeon]